MNSNIAQSFYKIFLKMWVFLSVAFLVVAMGEGSKQSRGGGPRFIELQRGAPSLRANVDAGGTKIEVYDISFGGTTKLGGIRREGFPGAIEFDLNEIMELRILDPVFTSVRYPDQKFLLAKVTFKNGTVNDDLLIPIEVQFSAKDLATEGSIKHAMELSKINGITIKHSSALAPMRGGRRKEEPVE